MASDYPSSIPTYTPLTDGVDDVLAEHQNQRADDIVAIATELGTDPAGLYATVKARLEAIEADVAVSSNHWPAYKNLLINGNMLIYQRGVSVTGMTTGSAVRSIDRWKFSVSNLGSWTTGPSSVDRPTDQGFSRGMYYSVQVADAAPIANAYAFFEQQIEGQFLHAIKKGTANAESLTLSFWVKSSKAGTHVVEVVDNDNARSISKHYVVDAADTWEYKTITIPPDTTGVFDHDNEGSMRVIFWLGAGSTFTSGTLQTSWDAQSNQNRAVGTANLADTVGNFFRIAGVQLEIGEEATDFEHLPYDVQLQRCMRYTQIFDTVASGQCVSATGARIIYNFPVVMRATPTLTFTVNGAIYAVNGTSIAVNSWGSLLADTKGLRISATVASGLVAGDATSVVNQSALIDAEL